MKIFELSKKKTKNGRRKFKMLLYQIFPDDCIDEENEVGTQYNENGITWIRKYCENALPSIKGMSLRCEFLDEERTELCGHGETGIVDGLPIFENAVVIGTFDEGYIDDVTLPDGTTITACIGVGTIMYVLNTLPQNLWLNQNSPKQTYTMSKSTRKQILNEMTTNRQCFMIQPTLLVLCSTEF